MMATDIFEVFYQAQNDSKSVEMAAYLKNQFSFLGIAKPQRAMLSREFLKEKKREDGVDWAFVFDCYQRKAREFHYLAISYLLSVKERLTPHDVKNIEELIVTNSWWDSVDSMVPITAELYRKYPEMKDVILSWAQNENLWLRRTAILFQLHGKEQTDTALLSRIIELNLDSKEFFINKAIGWALWEYSKTNRDWVAEFISSHPLSKLSAREASKYL